VKLMRLGPVGAERPVVRLDDTTYVDVSDRVDEFDETFFGLDRLDALRDLVAERTASGDVHAFGDERIGAPIARPHQILCIGLNYSDHAAETGNAIPKEPPIFAKWPNAILDPGEPILRPRGSKALDWEVELGVVIGKPARYVSKEQALDYVWGYTIINDASARDFQMITSQWMAGKIFETAAPVGPYIGDRAEVADPHTLGLRTWVNGKQMQNGTTKTFIFDVRYLVSYLSNLITLMPGDLIATGTPPGVGLGMKPPVYMNPGDVVRMEIDGLGSLENTVKDA